MRTVVPVEFKPMVGFNPGREFYPARAIDFRGLAQARPRRHFRRRYCQGDHACVRAIPVQSQKGVFP